MRPLHAAGLLIALALLSACNDLDTTYAARTGDSVNGIRVFHQALAGRCQLRDAWYLTQRVGRESALVVHVATTAGVPDYRGAAWIDRWLAEPVAQPRQALLILRDGNVAPVLATRWADEARHEAQVDAERRDELNRLAERYDQLAKEHADDHAVAGACRLFRLRRGGSDTAAVVQSLSGLGLGTAPTTLRLGTAPVPPERWREQLSGDALPGFDPSRFPWHALDDTADLLTRPLDRARDPQPPPGRALSDAEVAERDRGPHVLVMAMVDSEACPLVVSYPHGNNRLLVVANATALLDGALVDPAARRFAEALLDEVLRFHRRDDQPTTPPAAWITSLTTRDSESPPPSLLGLLVRGPFAIPLWHLLLLLAVLAWWRARWLGRREAPVDRQGVRFTRHVEALAHHLERAARRDPAIRRAADAAIAERQAGSGLHRIPRREPRPESSQPAGPAH